MALRATAPNRGSLEARLGTSPPTCLMKKTKVIFMIARDGEHLGAQESSSDGLVVAPGTTMGIVSRDSHTDFTWTSSALSTLRLDSGAVLVEAREKKYLGESPRCRPLSLCHALAREDREPTVRATSLSMSSLRPSSGNRSCVVQISLSFQSLIE